MVKIQPWVFITMCWSRQYDFNLVRHPTPKKWIFHPQAGFKPGSPQPQSKSDDLDRSAMGNIFTSFGWVRYIDS